MRRLKPTIWPAFAALAIISVSGSAAAQGSRWVIDGEFGDWQGQRPIYSDPQDRPEGGVDFGRLWIRNDDRFLFVSVEVGYEEILLQDGLSFRLYIDADADSTTGEPVAGLGAELTWSFGERKGLFVQPKGSIEIGDEDIGLMAGPTVTGTRFEFALDLEAEPRRFGVLFPEDTVQIALVAADAGDQLPEPGDRVVYAIDRSAPERPYDFDLARELDSDLRILAWNVEQDGFFDDNKSRSFEKVLQATSPDILGLTEIYDHSVGQTLERIESLLPPPNGERWYGSGSGFDAVIASHYPILRTFQVVQDNAAGGFLIDLTSRGAHDLFVVVAHLRCCEQDAIRQRQIDQIMAFIRDAKTDGTLEANTPIVIVGDMNFVGDSRQVATLTRGEIVNSAYQPSFDPDWDGSPFADRLPLTTGLPASITWPGRGSDFSGGRLDFVVFSDFVLETGRAFALNTPTIPPEDLQRLGLSASNTLVASDHLPVVADFRGVGVTAVEVSHVEKQPDLRLSALYPNPASTSVNLTLETQLPRSIDVVIIDALGRTTVLRRGIRTGSGRQSFSIPLPDLSSGVYLIRAETTTGLHSRGTVLIVRR